MARRAVERELVDVFARVGVDAMLGAGGVFEVSVGGGPPVRVVPVERSVLSAGRAADAVRSLDVAGAPDLALVVAEKIPATAREVLDAGGVAWFDRRGHLRMVAPGILIDTDVQVEPKVDRALAFPAGRTGVGAAVALLSRRAGATPTTGWSEIAPTVTRIADEAGVAVSGASTAISTFRSLGYVAGDGSPVVPDLFWATVEHWRPRWVGLVAAVDADPGLAGSLGANLDDLAEAGWCLGGDAAAGAWRAPVVGGDVGRRQWYVPDADTLDTLRWSIGEAGPGDRGVEYVAVAPTPAVCRLRAAKVGYGPVVPLAVAALDLALDRARGRESLDSWDPDEGTRVW